MNSNIDQLIKVGINYLDYGWSIIPILKSKKCPIKWKKYQSEYATPKDVANWIKNGYGLALVTGEISGITVIDDDRVKHGLKEYGFDSSIVSNTQNDGKHFYYRYKNEDTSFQNKDIYVDIKGERSYVLLPPFNNYKWINPPNKEKLNRLPLVTNNLDQLIRKEDSQDKNSQKNIIDIVDTEQGFRDNNLLWIANSLCNKHPSQEWDSKVLPRLIQINYTFKPPLQNNDVLRIYRQATTFIKNNPKDKKKEDILIPDISKKNYLLNDNEIIRYLGNTGIELIDETLIGFTPGTYVSSANEKVGKSCFLMNLACNWLENNKKVAVIDTEQGEKIYKARLVAKYFHKDWRDLRINEINSILKRYDGKFLYYGENKDYNQSFISDKNGRSWDKTLKVIKEILVKESPEFLIIDNLTSYANKTGEKAEWQIINSALQDLVSLSLKHEVAIFAIIHTNKNNMIQENATGIYKAISEKNPEKIFEQSISIDSKPTISSVKGGSASLSQVKGLILLWRPFRNFNDSEYNEKTMIIFTSFSNCNSIEIRAIFDPKRMYFHSFFLAEGERKGSLEKPVEKHSKNFTKLDESLLRKELGDDF